MKKFLALLFLLILPVFLTGAKQKDGAKYIDSNKKDTVTISIIAENKKQVATTDNIQLQLTKSVENQTLLVSSFGRTLDILNDNMSAYTKEVEKRNKSDGQLITDKFNYSTEEVKSIMKRERWLNFITWLTITVYIISMLSTRGAFNYNSSGKPWPILLIQCMVWTGLGFIWFFVVLNLLTLLFNPNYYVVKELINLYT